MEKKSNKGLKKLVLLLLLFIGLGASVTAGAYWASTVTATLPTAADGVLTVNIGEGAAYEFATTLSLDQIANGDLPLVPHGRVEAGISTDTREITFTANWVVAENDKQYIDGLASKAGQLNATIDSYSFEDLDDMTEINKMFSITITESALIEVGASAEIVVTVYFKAEPESKELYDLVANKELTINITLSVVAD